MQKSIFILVIFSLNLLYGQKIQIVSKEGMETPEGLVEEPKPMGVNLLTELFLTTRPEPQLRQSARHF